LKGYFEHNFPNGKLISNTCLVAKIDLEAPAGARQLLTSGLRDAGQAPPPAVLRPAVVGTRYGIK
jgi:hypothetical protein